MSGDIAHQSSLRGRCPLKHLVAVVHAAGVCGTDPCLRGAGALHHLLVPHSSHYHPHSACTPLCPCRYYFYAQDATSGALFLVELVVGTEARVASSTIKTDSPQVLPAFVELYTACLAGFYR